MIISDCYRVWEGHKFLMITTKVRVVFFATNDKLEKSPTLFLGGYFDVHMENFDFIGHGKPR